MLTKNTMLKQTEVEIITKNVKMGYEISVLSGCFHGKELLGVFDERDIDLFDFERMENIVDDFLNAHKIGVEDIVFLYSDMTGIISPSRMSLIFAIINECRRKRIILYYMHYNKEKEKFEAQCLD